MVLLQPLVSSLSVQYSMPVESGLHSALNRHTVRLFTESDDTRGCNNTICPPEDEQVFVLCKVFVLCLLCLYYVYCVCTMSIVFVLCLLCLYYVYVFVLCLSFDNRTT